MRWPDWWSLEIELTPHLIKRMADRRFNEVDLRIMMEGATGVHANHEEGRFVVETSRDGRPWEVVVEPWAERNALIVVTAYPRD